MLAVLIAAENGDEKHRGDEVLRRRQVGVGGIVGEEPQLAPTTGSDNRMSTSGLDSVCSDIRLCSSAIGP